MIFTAYNGVRKGNFLVLSVCLFMGWGWASHVTTIHDAIGQSQVTWLTLRNFQTCLPGVPLPLQLVIPSDMFKLDHFGHLYPSPTPTWGFLPAPQNLFKLVYYVADTSISKQAVGLLVNSVFNILPLCAFLKLRQFIEGQLVSNTSWMPDVLFIFM